MSYSALNMLLPLPRYLKAASDIDSLPPGEGTIINSGPLALRKVGWFVGGWLACWLGGWLAGWVSYLSINHERFVAA